MIDNQRLREICRIGQKENCCRYILCNAAGFNCGKHTDLRSIIDRRVDEGAFTAKGDNCEGLQP